MQNNTLLNTLRKNVIEARVEFSKHQKLWKGQGSPVIDVSGKKDSLLVYVLNFFRNFGGRGVVM